MTTVYLIRHGESEGNLFRICQGWDEELLSVTGRAQAQALGKRFRLLPITAVYTSDLCRCAATALPIAKPHHLKLISAPEMREIRLGALEGLSWGEVYHRVPALRTQPVQDIPIPNGETNQEVAARVLPFMDRVARKHDGESICVVSHGGAIGVFLSHTFPDKKLDLAGNTSVTTLHYENGIWTLAHAPETDHLTKAGIPVKPLFGKNILDLRFEDVDYERDGELVSQFGRDAWLAVFGSLNGYRGDLFCENARRMSKVPQMASLCLDGDKIAGILLLDPHQGEPDFGHISLVYLNPEYRYRGLGFQLIGHATVVYRKLGRKFLRLHVDHRNKSAIHFYQKCGFRFSGLPYSPSGQLTMKKNIEIPQFSFQLPD